MAKPSALLFAGVHRRNATTTSLTTATAHSVPRAFILVLHPAFPSPSRLACHTTTPPTTSLRLISLPCPGCLPLRLARVCPPPTTSRHSHAQRTLLPRALAFRYHAAFHRCLHLAWRPPRAVACPTFCGCLFSTAPPPRLQRPACLVYTAAPPPSAPTTHCLPVQPAFFLRYLLHGLLYHLPFTCLTLPHAPLPACAPQRTRTLIPCPLPRTRTRRARLHLRIHLLPGALPRGHHHDALYELHPSWVDGRGFAFTTRLTRAYLRALSPHIAGLPAPTRLLQPASHHTTATPPACYTTTSLPSRLPPFLHSATMLRTLPPTPTPPPRISSSPVGSTSNCLQTGGTVAGLPFLPPYHLPPRPLPLPHAYTHPRRTPTPANTACTCPTCLLRPFATTPSLHCTAHLTTHTCLHLPFYAHYTAAGMPLPPRRAPLLLTA